MRIAALALGLVAAHAGAAAAENCVDKEVAREKGGRPCMDVGSSMAGAAVWRGPDFLDVRVDVMRVMLYGNDADRRATGFELASWEAVGRHEGLEEFRDFGDRSALHVVTIRHQIDTDDWGAYVAGDLVTRWFGHTRVVTPRFGLRFGRFQHAAVLLEGKLAGAYLVGGDDHRSLGGDFDLAARATLSVARRIRFEARGRYRDLTAADGYRLRDVVGAVGIELEASPPGPGSVPAGDDTWRVGTLFAGIGVRRALIDREPGVEPAGEAARAAVAPSPWQAMAWVERLLHQLVARDLVGRYPRRDRMRLNKFISETGACSRREADAMIAAGRVAVNGAVAGLGTQVVEGDRVTVDGAVVGAARDRPRPVYIALNKPPGITCTTERQVEGNIIDFVDHPERIFPIGRLDKESEGLILLTNDGDIVNEVLRAEHEHEKEYVVAVDRSITDEFLAQMARGVRIPDGMTKPCKIAAVAARGFRIVLIQGLNRQIRKMCEALGYEVVALQRVRIMHIELGHLKLGRWRNLTDAEVAGLLPRQPRVAPAARAAPPPPTTKPRPQPAPAKPKPKPIPFGQPGWGGGVAKRRGGR